MQQSFFNSRQALDSNQDPHPLWNSKFYWRLNKNQTLSLTEDKKMLQTCQQRKERRILHVMWKDRVTNAEVRKRTSVKDIVAVAHSLRWTWGGHVARTDQRRWTHATSVWDVRTGERRAGRPKTR
jgi:hypothetical protein